MKFSTPTARALTTASASSRRQFFTASGRRLPALTPPLTGETITY